MTAGPWLGELFRRTVRPISKVVRQDIVYVSTPEAETVFDADRMPCWVDHGYGAYGTPSVEGCGVKAAIAWEETAIDLDEDERVVEASAFHRTRQYLRHRFPGLVGQRAVDQKACQIAMTPDTHFIIDFHPEHENVLIAGGCSGHLFKHGPMFGISSPGSAFASGGPRTGSPRPSAGPLARDIALRTLTGQRPDAPCSPPSHPPVHSDSNEQQGLRLLQLPAHGGRSSEWIAALQPLGALPAALRIVSEDGTHVPVAHEVRQVSGPRSRGRGATR